MVEVFVCWGDVGVEASGTYLDFSQDRHKQKLLTFEHSNYGGHYVISAEQVSGQYFIRVFNRQKRDSDVAYLITHSYYNTISDLPYKLVYLNSRQVSYSLSPKTVTFSFSQVSVRKPNSSALEIEAEYRLYLSTNKNRLSTFANCRLGNVAILTENSSVLGETTVSFPIDVSSA